VKKKITAFLLVLILAAVITACKQDTEQQPEQQPEQTTESVSSPAPSPVTESPSDTNAPAGWGDPSPSTQTPEPVFLPKIYPDPPDEGIPCSSIRVEDFLGIINPALIAAGRDEMLIEDASVDINMDEDPPLSFFFIFFSRSGLEIDFAVNRETLNIESAFIALYTENEYASYEADFYLNLFLIMFEPNEYSRLLDDLDRLDGVMETANGENWSILRQPTLINFFPLLT